jgi:hypothetical protein
MTFLEKRIKICKYVYKKIPAKLVAVAAVVAQLAYAVGGTV